MKKLFLLTFGIALMAMASNSNAQVTIQNLDVRSSGVFGGGMDNLAAGLYLNNAINTGSSGAPNEGGNVAISGTDPLEITITYSNLDLDGDTTANDAVTFTLRYEPTAPGGDLRAFGQGVDRGFGSLNNIMISVTGVTGTTTDSGDTIVFDGFTGIGLGGGNSDMFDIDRSAEVNGTTVAVVDVLDPANPPNPFRFRVTDIDFAATPTLSITNQGDTLGNGGVGSFVARRYDMQFSAGGMALKGDVDLDGTVTFLDINPFIMVLSSNGFQAEADCDCDGDVDFLDIQPFISILAGTP